MNSIHNSTRKRNPARTADKPVYEGGRIVGAVRINAPGKPFVKTVDSTKHMLRSPRAWAVGLESLTSAEALGSELVLLHDSATAGAALTGHRAGGNAGVATHKLALMSIDIW